MSGFYTVWSGCSKFDARSGRYIEQSADVLEHSTYSKAVAEETQTRLLRRAGNPLGFFVIIEHHEYQTLSP